jgi:hypothetical protein
MICRLMKDQPMRSDFAVPLEIRSRSGIEVEHPTGQVQVRHWVVINISTLSGIKTEGGCLVTLFVFKYKNDSNIFLKVWGA